MGFRALFSLINLLLAASASAVTLRQAADSHARLIGSAVNSEAFRTDEAFRTVLSREFNVLTPENAMKFVDLQPKRGVFEFALADEMVKFAEQNSMKVRGHALVWHEALPEWFRQGHFKNDQLSEILKIHIQTVVGHFKTKFPRRVAYWDVVNEAVGASGEIRDQTPWRLIGTHPTDFITLAFQTAHQADPDALLFYNDYGIEDMNTKSDAVFKLLSELKAKQIPVHGIGFQTHLHEGKPIDHDSVRRNFARFSTLGLKIHITEFDDRLDLPDSKPPTQAQLTEQAKVYSSMAEDCLATKACEAFVMWGFTDKYSWVPHFFPGQGAADLYDSQMLAKPAFDRLLATFLAIQKSPKKP